MQQLQLARDEAGVGRIAAPGRHVDDIQAGVDGGAYRRQLGHNQRRRMRCRRDGEVVCQGALGRREAGQAQLDVLRRGEPGTQGGSAAHTPLVMRVPMRVMRPLRLSERTDDSTSVDPFSEGASKAAHSSSPALSDCSVSLSWSSSQSSSRACDAACSSAKRPASMGGHTAVDMAAGRVGLGRADPPIRSEFQIDSKAQSRSCSAEHLQQVFGDG